MASRGACYRGWKRVHSVHVQALAEEKLYLVREDHANWGVGVRS
jgi:hypothetical protein